MPKIIRQWIFICLLITLECFPKNLNLDFVLLKVAVKGSLNYFYIFQDERSVVLC